VNLEMGECGDRYVARDMKARDVAEKHNKTGKSGEGHMWRTINGHLTRKEMGLRKSSRARGLTADKGRKWRVPSLRAGGGWL